MRVFDASSRTFDFGTYVFDWQQTPLRTVAEYICRDFRGVFEREQLVIDPQSGGVINLAYCTSHKHAFHATGGGPLTEKEVDDQYSDARQKFEYLAAKFRAVLRSDGPVTYVHFCVNRSPTSRDVFAFLKAVRRYNAAQVFRLALVAVAGQKRRPLLSYFAPNVDWYLIAPTTKTGEYEWEEDDESWEFAITAMRHRNWPR